MEVAVGEGDWVGVRVTVGEAVGVTVLVDVGTGVLVAKSDEKSDLQAVKLISNAAPKNVVTTMVFFMAYNLRTCKNL